MTRRWIWLVPSQIWVVVDGAAVPQVDRVHDDEASARIQHVHLLHLQRPCPLCQGQDYGLAGLGLVLTSVLDHGDSGSDRSQNVGGVRP